MTREVLTHRHGPVGHISLSRPKALHSLTRPMCLAMSEKLLEWHDDAGIEAVIIDHAEGRGFCAGGDVALVRRSALEDGGETGRAFFHAEYRLNHLLFTYPKPVLAFMDGVTMGGGVGLALPAKYRIATENTLFAMPEGAIGLFPDVGAGWYLPRLPGQVGKFLALTGARLDGSECLWAGLATHYLPGSSLAEAKARIIAEPGDTDRILADLSEEAPKPRLAGNKERIDRLFAGDTLEEIQAALSADPSDWAAKELKAVRSKCPASAKVALRQFAGSASRADFAEEMELEYRIASRMIMRPDFAEGVRAVLVDKDGSPEWNPASAEGVTETILEAIFAPLPLGDRWEPIPT
ncbi:enoyl-CoA hydratase [Altererythrobacter atlanticus]|uniref:3-hydroxyisobutyryl-CoA hydrolase n=1 Tax=Croceibacterium atlanticum TaxID=1267766 RepID=A0A0F7KXR2_9SPHN|nr:enoyl-CoA hydratase/isomerase family protein [Croceibacterium atlanticum]AKH44007.1 Carnitinyl-CoA dehydratase [Croceibacterium atlanticum]MBB5732313.1 enoyl-CoA hydratase [Croceibacterium atlanticum]